MKRSPRTFESQVVVSFEIAKSSEVVFYYDYFSDRIWANIRRFAKGERYTGPTKDGVKFDPKYLPDVLRAFQEAQMHKDTMSDEIFLRLPKNKSADLIVHASLYKGTVAVDFRERYRTSDDSEGWGRGIRLGIEHLADLISSLELMNGTKPDLKELGPQIPIDFEPKKERKTDVNIEGVPDSLKGFFSQEEENGER